ncbi:MAG: hypothetical protein RIC95_05380 [Vicingaceae bacterium]
MRTISKALNLFILFGFIIHFSSCRKKCNDRKYTCKGLSSEGQALLPKQLESKVFTNGVDSTLVIQHKGTFIGKASVVACQKDMFGICVCNEDLCNNNRGHINYQLPDFKRLDTNIVTYDSGSYYGNRMFTKDSIAYQVFSRDYGSFTTFVYESEKRPHPSLKIYYNGSEVWLTVTDPTRFRGIELRENEDQVTLLSQYSTPSNNYTNVIEVVRKLSTHYKQYPTKFYYHLEFGVIAFEDEKGTLFYQTAL